MYILSPFLILEFVSILPMAELNFEFCMTAKIMKNRGYPVSDVLLITGIPESEIEKL